MQFARQLGDHLTSSVCEFRLVFSNRLSIQSSEALDMTCTAVALINLNKE